MRSIQQVARTAFGYKQLRSGQKPAIESVLKGQDLRKETGDDSRCSSEPWLRLLAKHRLPTGWHLAPLSPEGVQEAAHSGFLTSRSHNQ